MLQQQSNGEKIITVINPSCRTSSRYSPHNNQTMEQELLDFQQVPLPKSMVTKELKTIKMK
jgi:hypothetical protein